MLLCALFIGNGGILLRRFRASSRNDFEARSVGGLIAGFSAVIGRGCRGACSIFKDMKSLAQYCKKKNKII
jgi:hypothetical protein